eukprot:180479_1
MAYWIIIGLSGAVLSIFVIVTILSLLIYRNISLMNKNKIQNQNIYIFSYLTLLLLLIPPISYTFIRSSYYNDNNLSQLRCYIGWLLLWPIRIVGKWALSSLYLYHLYLLQLKSTRIKRIHFTIASIFFVTLIPTIIISTLRENKFFKHIAVKHTRKTFCINAGPLSSHSAYALSIAVYLQYIYSIYVLIAFVYRFKKLKIESGDKIKALQWRMFWCVAGSVIVSVFITVVSWFSAGMSLMFGFSTTADAICLYILFFTHIQSNEKDSKRKREHTNNINNDHNETSTFSTSNGSNMINQHIHEATETEQTALVTYTANKTQDTSTHSTGNTSTQRTSTQQTLTQYSYEHVDASNQEIKIISTEDNVYAGKTHVLQPINIINEETTVELTSTRHSHLESAQQIELS